MLSLNVKLKYFIRKLASRYGYQLLRADAKQIIDGDPRSVLYHANLTPVIIEAPVYKARAYYVKMTPEQHLFCKALASAVESNLKDQKETIYEALKQNLDMMQYRNAAEKMGLADDDALFLAKEPGWFHIYPWQKQSIEYRRRELNHIAYDENRTYGLYADAFEEGHHGSEREKKIEMEAERLYQLLQSIQDKGYQRDFSEQGDVTGTMLIDDSTEERRWAWIIGSGTHRVAVMSVLGKTVIPVRIERVVYRNDAPYWPKVESGLFTKEAALKFFDRVIKGV